MATAALQAIFGPAGATIMAIAIIISTFGCNNGLILAGARVYYAMASDGLFFRRTGQLNARHVPAFGLDPAVRLGLAAGAAAHADASARDGRRVTYGNLYGDLLDYVIFAVLIFYVLTIAGLFVLRRKRPDAERPYRAFGYPVVPALYIVAADDDRARAADLQDVDEPGRGWSIVLTGIPVYFAWRKLSSRWPAPAGRRGPNVDFRSGGRRHRWRTNCLPENRSSCCWRRWRGRTGCKRVLGPVAALRPRRRRHHRRRHLRGDRRGGAQRRRPGPDALLRRRRHHLHLRRLCYAEFASMVPVAGSAYTYAYATLGELFAWIIGWDLVLEYAVGSATVATGWSGYFQNVLAKIGLQLPWRLPGVPLAL